MTEDLKELFQTEPDSTILVRAKEFYDHIQIVDRLKGELEKAQEKKDDSEAILFQAMENAGLDLVRSPELGITFFQRFDFYASIEAARKSEGYAWVRELGFGDLIYETINARTFSAFIKDLRNQNENLELPEYVNTTTKKKVGRRKK